jgi:hypothetical protein
VEFTLRHEVHHSLKVSQLELILSHAAHAPGVHRKLLQKQPGWIAVLQQQA